MLPPFPPAWPLFKKVFFWFSYKYSSMFSMPYLCSTLSMEMKHCHVYEKNGKFITIYKIAFPFFVPKIPVVSQLSSTFILIFTLLNQETSFLYVFLCYKIKLIILFKLIKIRFYHISFIIDNHIKLVTPICTKTINNMFSNWIISNGYQRFGQNICIWSKPCPKSACHNNDRNLFCKQSMILYRIIGKHNSLNRIIAFYNRNCIYMVFFHSMHCHTCLLFK